MLAKFLRCRIYVASESPKKTRFRLPHCCMTPPTGNPREYPHCQNLELFGYIVVADSIVYLHSNFRGGLRKTHAFLNAVRNGPSRSSKVVDFDTGYAT